VVKQEFMHKANTEKEKEERGVEDTGGEEKRYSSFHMTILDNVFK
jgi:hypothetical protein